MRRKLRIFLKLTLDRVMSLVLLVMLFPLMVSIAVVLFFTHRQVLFKQKRMSFGGKVFTCYKFVTMSRSSPSSGITSSNNVNSITPVGRVLRKYKLDELPQIINVLKGEMSFVGPRAYNQTVIGYITKFYPADYKELVKIKPGITGLSSIKFYQKEEEILKKSLSPENDYIYKILPKKLRYHRFYINNLSTRFDLLIMWWTIKHLFMILAVSCLRRKNMSANSS